MVASYMVANHIPIKKEWYCRNVLLDLEQQSSIDGQKNSRLKSVCTVLFNYN